MKLRVLVGLLLVPAFIAGSILLYRQGADRRAFWDGVSFALMTAYLGRFVGSFLAAAWSDIRAWRQQRRLRKEPQFRWQTPEDISCRCCLHDQEPEEPVQ